MIVTSLREAPPPPKNGSFKLRFKAAANHNPAFLGELRRAKTKLLWLHYPENYCSCSM